MAYEELVNSDVRKGKSLCYWKLQSLKTKVIGCQSLSRSFFLFYRYPWNCVVGHGPRKNPFHLKDFFFTFFAEFPKE